MKNITKLLFTFLIISSFFSCKKEVVMISYEGGTVPMLTADRSSISIAFATQNNEALKLMWTNPDYKFSTGLSSQDVSYVVEMAPEGTNFGNPKAIGLSKDLSISFTQGEMNDYLLNSLNLAPSISHSIEFRVKSSLVNSSVPLISNVLKFDMTPYAIPPKVTPPTTEKLYMVGNATPGGWNNPVPVPTQEFTKVSPTLYELTLPLTGGNSYLLLPLNGDWGVKYGSIGGNNSNNPNEDDFRMGGGDLLAPAVSGNYKIEVDFQRGKFKLTKL